MNGIIVFKGLNVFVMNKKYMKNETVPATLDATYTTPRTLIKAGLKRLTNMPWYNSITVEAVLFFFMLAVYMQFPAFQDLQYTKVCLQKYTPSVCDDLYSVENSAALDWVQTHASYWALAATLALSLPAILVSSLLGSWSDSLGRKLPMMIPSVGGAASALVYLCMSIIQEAPIHLILLGCLLTGICGGFSGCTMATMSYVADVSSAGGRTARVMLLEGMTFLGGTVGPLIAGFLMPVAGREAVFVIILISHVSVIAYVSFVLPQVRRNPEEAELAKGHGLISWYHMKQSLRSCFKRRQHFKRAKLLLYFAAMVIIIIIANGEMDVAFLYLKDKPFEWESSTFSYFIATKFGVGTVLLLIGGPLILRYFSIGDTLLTQIGMLSRAAGLVLLGLATTDLAVWLVTLVGAASYFSTPCLRALMSKQIEKHELGKVFACMSMLENVCLLLGSAIFNTLYPAVRDIGMPGFTFHVAAIMLVCPVALVWYASVKHPTSE